VHGWLAHIQSHQLLYTQQLNADCTFGCKILALIDRAIQLYFRECMHADRQVGAARLLVFDRYQGEIIMNTFNYTALPSSIAKLVARPTPSPQPTPAPITPTGRGTMAYNFKPFPDFLLSANQVATLQNVVSTAPTWFGVHGPCKVCPRFQSGGACQTDCPRAATHWSPTDGEIIPYLTWIRNKGQDPAKKGGGRPKSGQQLGNKRSRAPSPSPHEPKSDGKKKVKFAPTPNPTNSDF
jgi:hypothetical protein